jgi:mono/diheme cytochrome c family protein
MDELAAAVQELQAVVADSAGGDATAKATDELMSTVVEELQALRRRITLRTEADEEAAAAGPALSAEQIDAIAAAVATRLSKGRPAAERTAPAEEPAAHLPKARARARK